MVAPLVVAGLGGLALSVLPISMHRKHPEHFTGDR